MTSIGDTVFVGKQLFVDGKEVKGTNPGGFQTLAETLTAGNEAPGQTAIVGRLDAGDDPGIQALNGDINADSMECNNLNAFSGVVTPECVATNVNATNLFGQVLSTQTNINCTAVTTDGIVVDGEINWTNGSFNPPLVVSGTPSLSQVLGAGDDAGGQGISDLSSLDFEERNKVQTTIVGVPTSLTKCTNLDLTDATNTFPTATTATLAATLAAGNSAGTTNINMNSQSITSCNNFTGTTVNVASGGSLLAADAGTIQLAATTMEGDLDFQGVSATRHSIANANLIGCHSLGATGTTGTQGIIAAARQNNAPIHTVLGPYTPDPGEPAAPNPGLYFASTITTPTNITGPSSSNPTVCENLDLRSGTNLFSASPNEVYEWGGYWKNPQTIFPPPPYADGPADPTFQIPTINQVHLEFVQQDFPGWRYFAPMADNDCQIDPDDYMDLNSGAYIGGEARGGWPDAFYVETAPTTIAAHASQTVELWFPVVEYGYGRIYFALAAKASGAPANTAPTVIQQSFRLWMESENAPGFGDVRTRMCGMKWHLKDFFPTDGSTLYIYPVCRTDDNETTAGRLIIKVGDGQPLNGCNPGDPPEFDPEDTNAQNGQIIMRGYPEPAQWTDYESTQPPSWQTPGTGDGGVQGDGSHPSDGGGEDPPK